MPFFKEEVVGTPTKSILAVPDSYVAVSRQFAKEDSLAVAVGNRKIVKAGTIYPSNDAEAFGVVLNDLDVTDGDVAGAVIIFGFLAEDKLPTAPSAAAKTALNMIKFL